MSSNYLDVLDYALMDIDISNALFTESNATDFIVKIKNTLNELQIKVKEYAVLQNREVKLSDGKTITKYQKGIDDKVDYLLSLKSKNITSVDCYDLSKVRSTFPNMIDSLGQCIEANFIKDFNTISDIDKAYNIVGNMISDFDDLLDKYYSETRLNVDTAIKILRNSDDNPGTSRCLSTTFRILNSLESKCSRIEMKDNSSEVGKHHFYLTKKAISMFGKFAIHWIKILDNNYDIEFAR